MTEMMGSGPMNEPIHVLIVEDRATDAELLVRELRRSGFEPEWKMVQTEEAFLAELEESPDIILSDYSMPHFSGLEAARLLRASGKAIPFILVSGTVGEEVAVEAMKHGATDYLLKDRIGRLGPAVRRALHEVEELAQIRNLEAQFIEAQKMEVIGHLASGVAHDFNNILTVILGYSDLMLQALAADDRMRPFVGEIRHAGERANALTQQLLVFSRRQAMDLVVLDLNTVVAGADMLLRRLASEPGRGTTFNVFLPRVDQPLAASVKPSQAGPLPRGTDTLLMVEYEPSLRHLSASVLEGQGYTVLRAKNGEDALRLARDHEGEPIGLVVTDVLMPGTGGKVMGEWAAAAHPGLKILLTSANVDDAVLEAAVLEPGVGYLPKPYTPESLASKVRQMLDSVGHA